MTFIQPFSLADAVGARAEHEEAVALQGGTDVYVEVNFGRLRPASLLDLVVYDELRGIARENGTVRIGAGTTYHEMIEALGDDGLPALVVASRARWDRPHPQPGDDRRQLGLCIAGGRLPPAAARRGRHRRACLVEGNAPRARRGVLRRPEALRAAAGRAHCGGARGAGDGPAEFLQGRRAERDGDRGLLVCHRLSP